MPGLKKHWVKIAVSGGLFFIAWRLYSERGIDWPIVLLFLAGVILQAALLIQFEKNIPGNSKKFLGLLVFSFFIAFIADMSDSGDVTMHLLSASFLFCLMLAIVFKNKIIPVLNEKMLLLVNATTLYLVFKSGFSSSLVLAYAVGAVIVVLNALVPKKIPKWIKAILFAWYFILIITMPIAHFSLRDVQRIFSGATAAVSPEHAFVLGALFCFLLVHMFFLLEFLPIPSKRRTLAQAIRDVREHLRLLNQKYDDEQLTTVQALRTIAIVTILLAVNYYFSLVSDTIILSITLLLSSLLAKKQSIRI